MAHCQSRLVAGALAGSAQCLRDLHTCLGRSIDFDISIGLKYQVLIAGGFVALADPTTDLYTP